MSKRHFHSPIQLPTQFAPVFLSSLSRAASIIATAFLISGIPAPQPANAETAAFAQQDIDSNKVVAIASPYGEGEHQLLVLQQIKDDKQCWNVNGSDVKMIDPLLLTFDFTGICGRATDSNGYSIRMAGQDLGWRYSFQIVARNSETLLIGRPTGNKQLPELAIGRIKGVPGGFGKFEMEPGWRIAKRTFNGETLGHFYFTHEQSLASLTNKTIGLK
jgi:N-acetylmuramoyl-L-alanine amidase